MCLLIVNKSCTVFSDEFLRGVYERNSDGVGVMWAENGVLQVRRVLPTSAAEAIMFYREHAEGRDCVAHFRMTTHGDTNNLNCHPYEVFGDGSDMPLFMAHNGVLSTGNAKDKTRSDTYWFIEDYLKPILKDNPQLVFEPAFQQLLGSAIGNNRFAFMNNEGCIAITNERDFVEYEGSLLSNKYAWDYYGLHPNAPRYTAPKYDTVWYNYPKSRPAATVTRAPAIQLPLPIPATKRGGKKSKKSYQPAHLREVQEFMDQVEESNPDVSAAITFRQVEHMLRINTFRDPWDVLDLWQMCEISDEEFIDVVKNKKSCKSVLDTVAAKWYSDTTEDIQEGAQA